MKVLQSIFFSLIFLILIIFSIVVYYISAIFAVIALTIVAGIIASKAYTEYKIVKENEERNIKRQNFLNQLKE